MLRPRPLKIIKCHEVFALWLERSQSGYDMIHVFFILILIIVIIISFLDGRVYIFFMYIAKVVYFSDDMFS